MPIKRFSQFNKEQYLKEDVLSKAYALSQNSQHNSVSQKITSTCSKIENILKQSANSTDLQEKIDSVTNALIEFSQVLRLQNQQSTHVKNISVASTVLADDLNKTLEKHLSRLSFNRR